MVDPARSAAPTPLVPLSPLPAGLVDGAGKLVRGLYAGTVTTDPVALGPRRGRVRRWRYVAAGDADTLVGAAVVDLGYVGVAFAFAACAGRVAMAEVKRPGGLAVRVGTTPAGGAVCRTRRTVLDVAGDGSFHLDVPTPAGQLRAEVAVADPVIDATLVTGTAEGGWNATVKAAGSPARGSVRIGDGPEVALGADAGAWSDWTAGRQDRSTAWRWGAGAGIASDGRRVGVNVSTGMNGRGAGEDVVWWDGIPYRVVLGELAPVGDDPERGWQLATTGTRLELDPVAARRAHEQLPLVTSSYVQPFGTWTGRLPAPDGRATPVRLAGVAEDHLAVW